MQGRLGLKICGKWRLERVLGIGGMAAVYAAVHRNQNKVAIKMLHPEHSLNAVIRQRFLREGYVSNTVNHPGAVRVLDDDVSEDGSAFLVLELLEGESLEERRERHGGRLPAPEVLALTDQLLDVLIAAHEKGIVHRDLKPENLFLTVNAELKVLDFGIAQLREFTGHGSGTSDGVFMGTPGYMPPEQARARWDEVDARSDIWAVGATMFVLLSGRSVREATTVPEQLALAVRDPAPLLGSVVPDLPEPLTGLVDRALSYDKGQRFQAAADMQLAVREVLKLVGRPLTISVAVRPDSSQRAGSFDGDTMLASSEKAASPRAPVGITAPPATLTSGGPGWRRRSKRRWPLLAAFAAALVMLGFWLDRRSQTATAAATEPKLEPAATNVTPRVSVEVVPAPAASQAPPRASASAVASTDAAPSSAPKRVERAARAPLKAAQPAPPVASKPASVPPNADLFDRRF